MGKTFSIKVLFGIYLLLMAGKVFAFSCNVDGGSSIGAGTTSVYVNLDPVILPGQNLVVDLSQHICTVDSRNVTVNLPDFPGSAEIPLGVYCSSEQKLSFYLSGATTDSARQVFANTAPDATKASGVGVSLMRNGKTLATGENVSLGTVNKSKVPLGLSATYGQTGNKVAAGAVQSVIGVTFIYE